MRTQTSSCKLFFSLRVSPDWVREQQQPIKRDSLCKHYVGYRPHPLPSTVFFFFKSTTSSSPTRSSHAHSRAADTAGTEAGEACVCFRAQGTRTHRFQHTALGDKRRTAFVPEPRLPWRGPGLKNATGFQPNLHLGLFVFLPF